MTVMKPTLKENIDEMLKRAHQLEIELRDANIHSESLESALLKDIEELKEVVENVRLSYRNTTRNVLNGIIRDSKL